METIITMQLVQDLHRIIETAVHCSKVARVMPNGGDIVYGTARSVGSDTGCSMHGGDVRDMYLRVTGQFGMEHFWPVAALLPQVASGEFVEYDWS